jgi:hypothetical protein
MALPLRQIAEEIGRCLVDDDRARGAAEARRLAFSFVETFERLSPAERVHAVEDRPDTVGDAGFDALLAAVAEHVCATAQIVAPAWVNEPNRFLETWWFVSGLRSLHADALVHSPISFARRGVFITEGALSYA